MHVIYIRPITLPSAENAPFGIIARDGARERRSVSLSKSTRSRNNTGRPVGRRLVQATNCGSACIQSVYVVNKPNRSIG